MNRRDFVGLLASAAAAYPLSTQAQSKIFRVAMLTLDTSENADRIKGLLGELGYTDGRNLAFVHRSADDNPARLAALAEELVRDKPDVLVAGWGTLAPKALKSATSSIPIVFVTVGDPIGAGLVQSLAHPGGNVTGLSGQSTEFKSKQLELLLTCVPNQQVVGVLLNPDTPYTALALKQLTAAAEKMGVRLEILQVRQAAEFTAESMDRLVLRGATSLLIVEDPVANTIRDEVIAQARRLHLATITGLAGYAQAGALMVYGTDLSENDRRAAGYVDKILKGASPGDLPVEQPTKFRLVLNLKTARAFGRELPPSILVAADEVIE